MSWSRHPLASSANCTTTTAYFLTLSYHFSELTRITVQQFYLLKQENSKSASRNQANRLDYKTHRTTSKQISKYSLVHQDIGCYRELGSITGYRVQSVGIMHSPQKFAHHVFDILFSVKSNLMAFHLNWQLTLFQTMLGPVSINVILITVRVLDSVHNSARGMTTT